VAIDGWVIRTPTPFRSVWLALLLAKCMWLAKFPRATNDSLAWPMTDFYIKFIDSGRISPKYLIVCDEAVFLLKRQRD
jgi:hypothetical protein